MRNQPDVWTNGSDVETTPTYYPMAGQLVERTGVSPQDDVLDIGCGTGTVAITAARRGANVTGVDFTPAMLEHAEEMAEIAGVTDVEWQRGDACNLPFEDNRFDATLSSLGHMYGDPPEDTARELVRVTDPAGRIGFTSWTPTSVYPFIGSVVTTYLQPEDLPEFTEPPFAWGDSEVVRDRLGDVVDQLNFESHTALYPALSPSHFWRETVETSGPLTELLEGVPEDQRGKLASEAIETIRPYFDDQQNGVELEYLLTTGQL